MATPTSGYHSGYQDDPNTQRYPDPPSQSGRFRIDNNLMYYPSPVLKDSDVNVDDLSEIPRPPDGDLDPQPLPMNEGEGEQQFVTLPPIQMSQDINENSHYRKTTAHGYTVTCFSGVPKQINFASEYQRRVVLSNAGGSGTITVYLSSKAAEVVADGYPLLNGQTLTVTHTDAVWGMVKTSTATDYVTVGVYAEYSWPVA